MASRKSRQAVQPTHEQDGHPVADQASGDPFSSGETSDPATEFNPANFQAAQAVVQSVADSARLPDTQVSEVQTKGHHPHSKHTYPAGDMFVHFLDKGDNKAGVGVRVEFPEGSTGRPTAEEKEIIRENMKSPNGEFPSGFIWRPEMNLWHKEIGRDAPPHVATAIRFDAERRAEAITQGLRQLHGIKYSHADKAQESKAQGADPIPF